MTNAKGAHPQNCGCAPLLAVIKLYERIFLGIKHPLGLVEGNILNPQIIKYGKQSFTDMSKGHRAVVGVTLGNKHMAVEPAHLRNGKDAYAAKGPCRHRQNLTLGNIRVKGGVCGTLQTVKGDPAGSNIPLHCAAGEIRFTAILQQAVLDELIFNGALR